MLTRIEEIKQQIEDSDWCSDSCVAEMKQLMQDLLQELDFHQGINISAVLEIKQLKQEIAVRDLALELQNSYSHDLVDGSESNVCEVAGFIRVARKQLSKEDA